MRRVCFSAAMSLDGFIAGPNGEADWITMDPDIDFKALFSRFDTALMGRKTYETSKSRKGAGGMSGMTAVVFSRTLNGREVEGASLSPDPAAKIGELKAKPGKDLWLFGGGGLLRSFLELGLVDEVQVAVIPVLLGAGVPLVPPPEMRSKLRLVKHSVYEKTGTAVLEYVPVR